MSDTRHDVCGALILVSDIHARAELSERILDDATLRRLSTMGE